MLPPGFLLLRGWARDVSYQVVRTAIEWEERTLRMFGKSIPVPRLTAWYGTGAYTYSGVRHEPAPMPGIVAEIHARLAEYQGAPTNSVLANLYRDGRDSVAWHADDEPELGDQPTIASLSLGAMRKFQIRLAVRENVRSRRIWSIDLQHGDLLVMTGRSQSDYQHRVPRATPAGGAGPRVNLTFRTIGVVS